MNRLTCAIHETYHVFNRGVDKREIFLTDDERAYFIHLLYVLNDVHSTYNIHRHFTQHAEHNLVNGYDWSLTPIIPKRERLVDILAFVLMPNHFHLMLTQRSEKGISAFMHRLGTGFTNYFNLAHERSGALFQGTYKRVHVSSHEFYNYLPHYIHLNPLPIVGTKDKTATDNIRALLSYRWSSFPDYMGKRNFPSVIDPSVILKLPENARGYRQGILKYIESSPLNYAPEKTALIDYD
ncbi:MAG: transposase [Candidatus Pacebacteria bacterium]|nr:transposase [Candidatus Paceibacterota bacterium]